MQHKEEGRKPAKGALHQGRAGASFFIGLSSSGQQEGGGGTPYEGRGGVRRERNLVRICSFPQQTQK